MTLYVTYCSREKKRGESLTAVERYDSDRVDLVHELAGEEDEPFAILSGRFGLVEPDEEVPFYDQLLAEDGVEAVAGKAAGYLARNEVGDVRYFKKPLDPEREPYLQAIENACRQVDADFETVILED